MRIIFHPVRSDTLAPLEAEVREGHLYVCGAIVEPNHGDALPTHPHVVRAGADQVTLLLPYRTRHAPQVAPMTVLHDGPLVIPA